MCTTLVICCFGPSESVGCLQFPGQLQSQRVTLSGFQKVCDFASDKLQKALLYYGAKCPYTACLAVKYTESWSLCPNLNLSCNSRNSNQSNTYFCGSIMTPYKHIHRRTSATDFLSNGDSKVRCCVWSSRQPALRIDIRLTAIIPIASQ